MGKRRWHLSIIVLLLAVLIGSTIGCVTVVKRGQDASPSSAPKKAPPTSTSVPTSPTARLVIEQFTATPDNITAGESVTLSWEVTNAMAVTIQPDVGKVNAKGSTQVKPIYTTVYILIAANQSGETQSSVTVTVGKAVTGMPDLKITNIWIEGETIYYTIENVGTVAAKPSWPYLYINGQNKASNYVETIAPGQERTGKFDKYPIAMLPDITVVKVCADAKNEVTEGDEGNNCSAVIWGLLFTYDFTAKMPMAEWRSDAGVLKYPMAHNIQRGSASLVGSYMVTCPEHVSQGWIQGRFADYYQGQSLVFQSRPFLVPEQTKFTSNVILEQIVPATSVTVALGYMDVDGSIAWFPKMEVYSDGLPHPYEIDLSAITGKTTEFFLRVECKGSWEGTCLQWRDPKITQVERSFP